MNAYDLQLAIDAARKARTSLQQAAGADRVLPTFAFTELVEATGQVGFVDGVPLIPANPTWLRSQSQQQLEELLLSASR